MKFTQEDVDTTIDEIKENLSYKQVEHVRDNHFNITANYWLDDDFNKAREIGLDIHAISAKYLGKVKVGRFEVDGYGIEVEVEWIGKHRIVM